jgi:NADH dehydrogenase
MHRIIVVGGGAGGLELVTRLGDRLGAKRRKPKADVTLVDINPTHVWKPLLHEVAAGSIEVALNQLEYSAQAHWHGFNFKQGALTHLDRAKRQITISAVQDDIGMESFPQRILDYDTLILAIGSITNFFNVPGAETHCFTLDTTQQAEHFRKRFITACRQAQQGMIPLPLHINIIGAGATGVELAAELRNTIQTLAKYDLHGLDPNKDIHITLIEATPRILPALPERLSKATEKLLNKLSINIKVNALVTQIDEKTIHFKQSEPMPSHLTVWAAGVKASPILATLDGLAVNKQSQILVHPTLQSITDADIFALGDCASCPWMEHAEGTRYVPPRAQAAHQQGSLLVSSMKRRLAGKSLRPFRYRDYGSIISLGRFSAVGNLYDGITRRGFMVRGWIARIIYSALYRLHLAGLYGWISMISDTIANWFSRSTRPQVKLH